MTDDVTVRLGDGWAIYLDNVLVGPGDHLEVDPDLAAHWVSRGWAVRVPDLPRTTPLTALPLVSQAPARAGRTEQP